MWLDTRRMQISISISFEIADCLCVYIAFEIVDWLFMQPTQTTTRISVTTTGISTVITFLTTTTTATLKTTTK